MLDLLARAGGAPESLPPVKHLMQGLMDENIVWGIRIALLACTAAVILLYVAYSRKNRSNPDDKGE